MPRRRAVTREQLEVLLALPATETELIRHWKDLPNPAVYLIETPLSFPVDETLLPVAKRSLVKFISAAA